MPRAKFQIGDWVISNPLKHPYRMNHLSGCIGRIRQTHDSSPRYDIIWYPPEQAITNTGYDFSSYRSFWGREPPMYLLAAPERLLSHADFFYALCSECLAPGYEPIDSLADIAPDEQAWDKPYRSLGEAVIHPGRIGRRFMVDV